MIVYQFALPTQSNDGTLSYWEQLREWENEALAVAGGFTDLGDRTGVWRDDKTDEIYREQMAWYEVAVDESFDVIIADRLLDVTRRLFPDQKAFYVAKVGTAEIV
jgi:hypothetical protein